MTQPEAPSSTAPALAVAPDAEAPKTPRTHTELARQLLELATASDGLQEREAQLTGQLEEVRRRRDAVDDELLQVRHELAPGRRERKKSRTPTQAASSKSGSSQRVPGGAANVIKASLKLAPRKWRTTRQCFEMIEASGASYGAASSALEKLTRDRFLESRKATPGDGVMVGARPPNMYRRVAK